MTRDLPSDADAGDAGDRAGDTAYRVATGVARVARAGAYLTGGALIASGGGTPDTPHSEDESQIAGWSVKDPQPNAPSPVVTYPDPSPESAPPATGHQAPAAPHDGTPGLEFHFHIGAGDGQIPDVPGLNQVPGMNGIPGTDGGTPGMNMVPNTESVPGTPPGAHVPGLGDVPGLGNGIPGLPNGIPGLGNGIPGMGNTPGFHIPGFGNGDHGLPGMHPAAASIAADGAPGFSPAGALSSLVQPAAAGFGPIDLGDHYGDGSDFGQYVADDAAPRAVSGGALPGFHLPGQYGFEGAGFDGVGSDFGAFVDVSSNLNTHIGLDGVWLNVDTQVHVGIGDIGEELDNYGNYGGWPDAQHGPGGMPAFVAGVNPGMLGAQSGMGAANVAAPGSAMPAAHAGPSGPGAAPAAFGVAPGAPAAAPVSGVVLPGASATSVPGIAGVPGVSAAPSVSPALSAPAPVLGAALPAVSPTPVLAAAPSAAVALPQPVAPAPALAAPAIAVAQPVVATPLQPAPHPDVAAHPLIAALPEHGAAFPLGIGAATVSSAGFLGIPHSTPPSGDPSAEHTTPTATQIAKTGSQTSAPAIPHVSIGPVPVSGTETPGHTTHPIVPTPIDQSGSPTTGADGSTAAHPGTHGSTNSDAPTTPAHPSTADDSTTHARPGATDSDGTTPAHPSSGGSDDTTAAHSTPTNSGGSTTHAHPGSTGTGDATTVPHAADSSAQIPDRDSTQPSRDHGSSPSHDSPTVDSPPSHGSVPTYDSPPTRMPVPTHDSVPTVDAPRGPSAPAHVPSMPTHEAPPTVSIPGGGGDLPGAHLAPHAPILPPTFEPGLPNPMKPIAHVMNSNDPTPWDFAAHAGLSAVPPSLLSGGLTPGSELYPVHSAIHPVPDFHMAL